MPDPREQLAKIKCNGNVDGIITGAEGLLSDCAINDVRFFDVNKIIPEMRSAIERITDMIKAEMPDYLISSEELNALASDTYQIRKYICFAS